ncbi:MAG: AAA family ATPase [Arcobacteraceae bacterium]|jgi:predicted ATP-binding protein involved in virulence|nr:AAA family ATPase [Arcobacteraceae bacterium]
MKLIYIFLEDDYKNIPQGGYSFDDEFIVEEFNTTSKTIKLKTNDSYHKPFNSSIQNITCVVGKNGIGKTTFFELLIAPLLWRLDGKILEDKLHLLFYDDTTGFIIQSYKQNSYYDWNVTLTKKSIAGQIDLKKNYFPQNNNNLDKSELYNPSDFGFAVLPFQTNIIFHSLSPFDRIYLLLKKKLSEAPNIVQHYQKRFKYIGIKQIENDEISYEYMTIINLLNLFFRDDSNRMINEIGYKFKNIKIEFNNEYFNFDIQIPLLDELDSDVFNEIKAKYSDLELLFSFYMTIDNFNDTFFNTILLKNLNISSKKSFEKFIQFVQSAYKDTDIVSAIKKFIENIQLHIDNKFLFHSNQYNFLKELIEKKENYQTLKSLENDDELKKIVENEQLYKLLQYIKSLTAKGIVNFHINLEKNDKEINYFRLSSGEKTLLSYFANIVGRINELYQIQAQDKTYNSVQNKLFLILIDEVELHLHPEWQRNFIKYVEDFFNYKEHLIRLQFVIATHSPFVVSDIYDQNIIYLGNKDKETKTFGGNIFDIFKDDFYVSNTIGAFSESIIKELSEFLYFLFVFEKAKTESNFFMLRDFLDLMYSDSSKKDDENQDLITSIGNYLNKDDGNKDLLKISANKYLVAYREDKEKFFKQAKNIIENIGEDVIRQHLEKMHSYLKDVQ